MKYFLLLLGLMLCHVPANASLRKELVLKKWQFSRDSIHWSTVNVPHDWAISGPFDKKWDLQVVAIVQNGEKHKTEHTGRTGALPWVGKGFYRTTVQVTNPQKHHVILFDGAMSRPRVYVNGRLAGHWAYGYNAFEVDVTPFIEKGINQIDVSLDNLPESSRWYPGGGLYRPVKWIETGNCHLDLWHTAIRTLNLNPHQAQVEIQTQVQGVKNDKGLKIIYTLFDSRGNWVANAGSLVEGDGQAKSLLKIAQPQAWSPESPSLYNLKLSLMQDGRLLDRIETRIGLRTITINKQYGLLLNGHKRKLQGVCLHHDLGPLGAAVNKAALIRQIKILKDMGCDAIRTAHNMPSKMQMEVCDSLGMMVMAESFDMWKSPKCKNGYGLYYDQWADKDLENLIRNMRNHPSIIMWSIGNEIPEQASGQGVEMARHLQSLCHKLDPTRMVTMGVDMVDEALKVGLLSVMDIPGLNYRTHKYEKTYAAIPQGFLLGSETASTISSRGVYHFPVVVTDKVNHRDRQCSGYDVEYCGWSNLPEDDFLLQDDKDWTIGQFVWTGFDYLGEPTPYDGSWPSRSSYFGICDLAGLPKDRFYLYRSLWNKHSHTLHLLPHWTWPDREGQVTPVYCYTDFPQAELFVNGKSMGRKSKEKSSKLDRYRIRWNDVKYEPGELKVVAYDSKGNVAGQQIVHTAGTASALRLSSDRTSLRSDGEDLAFVTVSLTDKNGSLIPQACDRLGFEVTGAGVFKAACNGDATDLNSFTKPEMKLFSGQLVVVIQSSKQKGEIVLKVTDLDRKEITSVIKIKVE